MWPFTTRRERQLQAELDAVKADRERIRGERTQFAKDRDTARFNREQILRQLAEADATNRRVHDRNLELGRRISELTESDPEYAAQLESQVAELQQRLDDAAREAADGEWRGRARRAEKRADHLQKELDNALGMPPGGVLSSASWQPANQLPKQDKAVSS
ncbi:hypothetical protein STRTUCAR8_08628 [Streptomyces turgidiscabies Car8]|uniref:Uncharacterized protein n=1 Tax=Streptomyces turgidiscabies (strain Car8) TaxID=698760 RepID=L7F7S4_STRT8|nr:hypothetical protein [Streptomyces turgidiscabies]ELP67633.1 hypothetical protein STRTUCAR8_08628 [Streptomyces turgidiscabies Car8]